MKALVVYESMFGNTKEIAEAVGEGLSAIVDVTVVEVGHAPAQIGDVDLLVVGGPTHVFGMSRPQTRESATEQATEPLVSEGPGIREWLDQLPGGPGLAAAAFDTKVDKPWLPGSASGAAARRMRKLGYRVVVPPESFLVDGTTGPLLDGEGARARAWGEHVAADVVARSSTRADRGG